VKYDQLISPIFLLSPITASPHIH